jgi:hypothetical protein
MLKRLSLNRVGPAPSMTLDFDPRLNVLTGDNGLGKSFVLDVAWWALTGRWAGEPAVGERAPSHADNAAGDEPRIAWDAAIGRRGHRRHATLPPGAGPTGWTLSEKNHGSPSLALYARIDGGVSVWDPYRDSTPDERRDWELNFSAQEIWDGKPLDAPRKLCEGLIRDWRDWQQSRDTATFDQLTKLLEILSPEPTERIRPGSEARPVTSDDVRRIPRIALPYGEIPITQASAGMRRVLSLAYMLLWVWQRHREGAALYGNAPVEQMVLLVDEVEAHLHPRWQRVIVRALMGAVYLVQQSVKVQVLMTTHSPLVLASLEPLFEERQDQLFNFRVVDGAVRVERVDWTKHGDASGWLQSAVFGLEEARSKEAEVALERATAFLRKAKGTAAEARGIQEAIGALLPGTDPFWATWTFGLRRKGIEVKG